MLFKSEKALAQRRLPMRLPRLSPQANAALLHQSILWLLRLVNLVILVVSSEIIHSASEFSAAELTMNEGAELWLSVVVALRSAFTF